MSLLTISITVLWAPNLIYYTISMLVPAAINQAVNDATSYMMIIQSIIDPILFCIVHRSMRDAITWSIRSVLCW